ncbi:MAG: hypothetical protein U0350_50340 [Caldilineaceae bacterium]
MVDRSIIHNFINDGLWLLIIVGWIFLIAAGLEADKPMSGGIPGHAIAGEEHTDGPETWRGRLGRVGAWVVFGLASLALPVVLWWIFAVHGG